MNNKIAVIGNGGGGKTTLSRILAERYALPVVHVDSIQYLPGLAVRDREDTSRQLSTYLENDRWIIDGFGSEEVMRQRFASADRIIFVDFALWRHFWWSAKRQMKSIWSPRPELPVGCDEATFKHTVELFKIVWRVHREIRPKLLTWFSSKDLRGKVVRVHNLKEWNDVATYGL